MYWLTGQHHPENGVQKQQHCYKIQLEVQYLNHWPDKQWRLLFSCSATKHNLNLKRLPKCVHIWFRNAPGIKNWIDRKTEIWQNRTKCLERLCTVVWCTDCEEPAVQGVDVRVVLHLYGNHSGDFPEAANSPPTTWWENPMLRAVTLRLRIHSEVEQKKYSLASKVYDMQSGWHYNSISTVKRLQSVVASFVSIIYI